MNPDLLNPTADDRLLVIAPHPDDESLATGALLQRAFAAKAAVRVLFVTKGDNNPWPQRVEKRKWRITAEDRAAWGERRRKEAMAALEMLGGGGDLAEFLGLPDQGVTQMLLAGGEAIRSRFSEEISRWCPTKLVIPCGADRHPDHSAIHVLAWAALGEVRENCPEVFQFLVHHYGVRRSSRCWALRLTQAEIERKRAAILCHETQVALSRKRFLAYAKPTELYTPFRLIGAESSDHPVRFAERKSDALRIELRLTGGWVPGRRLKLAFQNGEGRLECRSVRLAFFGGSAPVYDGEDAVVLGRAGLVTGGGRYTVELPARLVPPSVRMYAKVVAPRIFFDPHGWREVPVRGNGRVLLAERGRALQELSR